MMNTKTRKHFATINGCVAINSDIDQHRPLAKYEKTFGSLSYLGEWNGNSIYVRHGSAAAVAKEAAMITFNQTLVDLGLGIKPSKVGYARKGN